ncbi:MAG: hypothetical protein ACT4OS_01465 [Acidimicrobiales bacterium]
MSTDINPESNPDVAPTAAPAPADDSATVAEWVRQELRLEPDAEVGIKEQPGKDPRCSPVITEVTVSNPGETAYVFHIEHALEAMTRMDVVAALAFGHG